jgi:hypothetical protein
MNKTLQSKLTVLLLLLCFTTNLLSQTATVSVPFAVGRTSCGSGTHEIHYYNYNQVTNALSAAAAPTACRPLLRTGFTNFTFTSDLASVSYNPADTNLYYLWTRLTPPIKTFAWKWPVGTCPTNAGARLDTIRSFNADILGVAFDANGNGYLLEFGAAGPPYRMFLRSINFSTGAIGQMDTLDFTNGKKIYQSGSGDVAISPNGQMYFVVDNKLFTPNYTAYGGAGKKITCTYIDTVRAPGIGYDLNGLTYAQGELISSYSFGANCRYREIDPLSGDTVIINPGAMTLSAPDLASIISGIGVAKSISSISAAGGGSYNVSYDIVVKNVGNIPIRNIQVTDNLAAINTLGTVSNVTTSFVTNPGGAFTLNTGYNGVGVTSLLTANPTARLNNFPSTNNSIIIRVNCRISNISIGVVYNNSAVATANGFLGAPLRDVSTTGTNPDLNSNDVPDDPGEDKPTPFLLAVTTVASPCTSLFGERYKQTFGTGTGLTTVLPIPTGKPVAGNTTYTPATVQPLAIDQYVITNNANNGNTADWINLTDHTGDVNGRMLLVNADVEEKVFYRDTINGLCQGQQYSFFFYGAFVGNSNYQTLCDAFGGFKYPRVRVRVRDRATGLVLAQLTSTPINTTTWGQYGFKWTMPAGFSNVILELLNLGEGGCGNDIAIDDIQLGVCDPLPVASVSAVSAGCLGSSTVINADLSDVNVIPGAKTYWFERSTDGGLTWTTIQNSATSTYTIASVTAADVNVLYRVTIAANGNIGTPSCRYTSPSFLLTAKQNSVTPTSATSSKNNICPGDDVNLRVNGGTLGTNANWRWYTGSCGGTLVGTGTTITVNPTVNTTYYVRAEGDCNTTFCRPITVTINCDIDDDNDGIPDLVENNGVDVEGDDDLDGIANWNDNNIVGFVDSNSDGVDDRYDFDQDGIINQYDLDADNDGIPDVMEVEGVDANGDGKIDNYTDTDVDGFSQNVDANNTGHLTSGAGLNRLDLDGDGLPNFLDLDSDGDGIPDLVEAGGADVNNNGRVDVFTDADNDGYTNTYDTDIDNNSTIDNTNALIRTGVDGNSNGRADNYPYRNIDKDGRANPYDLDSDGDGLSDVFEIYYGQLKISGTTQFNDVAADGFVDGTTNAFGWNTTIAGLAAINLPDFDGDGKRDYLDIDADNDGATDNIEIMTSYLPGAAYIIPTAVDADNDGLDDQYDNFLGQFRGGRLTPVDTDGDSTPDYLDLDTDNDGQIDIIECNDNNFNGLADDNITLTNLDTDGDGLDNRFDNDNTNHKVTSSNMGTAGSFTGPAPTGTLSMVTRSYTFQSDRDWRFNGMILSINLLSFNGNLANQSARLSWTYIANEAITNFIVERSFDGINFNPIATLPGTQVINQQQNAVYTDVMGSLLNTKVYYRLKMIGANTRQKQSQVIVLKVEKQVNTLQVIPTPAATYFNVNFAVIKNGKAQIELIDANGKIVAQKELLVYTGMNTILFNNVDQYPSGIYVVKVLVNQETIYGRVIIK